VLLFYLSVYSNTQLRNSYSFPAAVPSMSSIYLDNTNMRYIVLCMRLCVPAIPIPRGLHVRAFCCTCADLLLCMCIVFHGRLYEASYGNGLISRTYVRHSALQSPDKRKKKKEMRKGNIFCYERC
jgi:hypothetical protein